MIFIYKIVGIGECIISDDVTGTLKTFALASCVALTVYCPSKKVLGMAHIALPYSGLNTQNDSSKIGYFADNAVPFLFKSLCSSYRCYMNELDVRLYGGADSININDIFNIGRRNIMAITTILNKNKISFCANQTGGIVSRTVEVDIATGTAKIEVQPIII